LSHHVRDTTLNSLPPDRGDTLPARFMNLEIARQQMISQQLRAWDVHDARILEVMASVPREWFVPPEWRALAYADTEIPLGHGRILQAPKLQGRALQALLPQPEERALEIGSGTGYLTACLARLTARAVGVEQNAELAAAARGNLARLGIDHAEILVSDVLAMNVTERFDVVCVNGSLRGHDPRLEELLEIGGRLFVVVGKPPIMQARKIIRVSESEWRRRSEFETCVPPLEETHQTEEFVF
jgi:protein-L-isoaspartate(D-aspartate) O-methyltransferase